MKRATIEVLNDGEKVLVLIQPASILFVSMKMIKKWVAVSSRQEMKPGNI